MKLVRATVPMCPECGCGAMLDVVEVGVLWRCPDCKEVYDIGIIAWGYYPPDVSGVVKEMEKHVRYCVGQSRSPTCRELWGFIHRLEGLK